MPELELERALTSLGRELDYPQTPDLAGSVGRRLATGRRPRGLRRPLVAVLAALLLAAAAALAVPQARSTILDWLGIGGVTIRLVDELPTVAKRQDDLALGRRVGLEEARARAPFGVRVPSLAGLEDPAVYRGAAGQVSLLYGSEAEPTLLITQLAGAGALEKLLEEGRTAVELVREEDATGAWLEGGEHVLLLPASGPESQRLVGNTLVLEREDGVTVRIEADLPKEEALRVYRSMR